MYRIAVCEDELNEREQLCALCGEILGDMQTEHEILSFSSAAELEQEMNKGTGFQLLCLDIIMPDKSGMDLALEVRERNEKIGILFVSGSTEYLLEGYEARPIQYLLKPVDREQLEKVLRTALRLWQRPETVTIREGRKTCVLALSDILYVESINHGSRFHLEKEDLFFWLTLSQVEQLLPSEQFCRCHKSFVVNMKQIREAEGRRLLLSNGISLDVGSRYAMAFKEKFVYYLNS